MSHPGRGRPTKKRLRIALAPTSATWPSTRAVASRPATARPTAVTTPTAAGDGRDDAQRPEAETPLEQRLRHTRDPREQPHGGGQTHEGRDPGAEDRRDDGTCQNQAQDRQDEPEADTQRRGRSDVSQGGVLPLDERRRNALRRQNAGDRDQRGRECGPAEGGRRNESRQRYRGSGGRSLGDDTCRPEPADAVQRRLAQLAAGEGSLAERRLDAIAHASTEST